ncbi:helix-turn-helix domain-containing protein [Rhodococcus hoagii]|nr:helix-turn-helix domain-containing protein [Prescottella equi]NKS61636.1 helix-turn-helix domain-containing protein [Prescottella equi]NKZ93259.1 helix-turn-helix domain-containing protein [Prescottella equi]
MSRRILRGFDRSALVAARVRAKLGPAEVARLADVSAGAVYSWERGDATPGVDTLSRVARVLRVPIRDLVPIPDDELYLGDLRVLAGLTQPALAKKAGMSTSSLAQLERGQARLKVDVAQRIADALSPDDGAAERPAVSVEQVIAAHDRVRNRPPHTRP